MKTFFYITTPIILLAGLLVWSIPSYQVRKEIRDSKHMTNGEIVEQTRFCEDNGLTAITYPHYGGHTTEYVTCFPTREEDTKTGNTYKKSNITEVDVNIFKDSLTN